MKQIAIILLLFVTFIGVSSAGERKRVWVTSFNRSEVGAMPKSWHGRSKSAKKYYKVKQSETNAKNRFLSASSINSDQFIIKKVKVDIAKYPYLNWRWRVNTLPKRGNESVKKYCDVAASVNVILYASKWRPKTIKYSWSTTLPKGKITASPYAIWPARADIVVMRSGARGKGKWVREKRNILEDYKRFYKLKEVKSKVIDAIVIMTDSDNTRSLSEADYDDIYFSTN